MTSLAIDCLRPHRLGAAIACCCQVAWSLSSGHPPAQRKHHALTSPNRILHTLCYVTGHSRLESRRTTHSVPSPCPSYRQLPAFVRSSIHAAEPAITKRKFIEIHGMYLILFNHVFAPMLGRGLFTAPAIAPAVGPIPSHPQVLKLASGCTRKLHLPCSRASLIHAHIEDTRAAH